MEIVSAYFGAERAESIVFIVAALFALAGSAWCLLVLKQPFFTGMAISLSIIAVLQLIVGVTIYQRSPHDTARVHHMIHSEPDRLQSEEVVRMQKVMRNFKIYLGVELVLLILSLLVLIMMNPGSFILGAALGLAVQAGFTAVLDFIAMLRGGAYLNWLLLQS
jgi:hypothetical protein